MLTDWQLVIIAYQTSDQEVHLAQGWSFSNDGIPCLNQTLPIRVILFLILTTLKVLDLLESITNLLCVRIVDKVYILNLACNQIIITIEWETVLYQGKLTVRDELV